MTFLNCEQIDRIERSLPYFIVDIVFNWIGWLGEIALILYVVWFTWNDELPNLFSRFGLKIFVASILLLATRSVKDELFARLGFAPPDSSLWLGSDQEPSVLPSMDAIREAQYRGVRIESRGIRVRELLDANQSMFHYRSRRTKAEIEDRISRGLST